MKKMTEILNKVDVKVQPLNSELVYLTENDKQVGSLILIYSGDDASIFSLLYISISFFEYILK